MTRGRQVVYVLGVMAGVVWNYFHVVQVAPPAVDVTMDFGRVESTRSLRDGFTTIPNLRYPGIIDTYVTSPSATVVLTIQELQRYRLKIKLRFPEVTQTVTVLLNDAPIAEIQSAQAGHAQKASYVLRSDAFRHGTNTVTLQPRGGTRPPVLEALSVRNFWGYLDTGDAVLFLSSPRATPWSWAHRLQLTVWWVLLGLAVGLALWLTTWIDRQLLRQPVEASTWALWSVWVMPQVLLGIAWGAVRLAGFTLAFSPRLFAGVTVVLPALYLLPRLLIWAIYRTSMTVATNATAATTAMMQRASTLLRTALAVRSKTLGTWVYIARLAIMVVYLIPLWGWLVHNGIVIFAWLMSIAFGCLLVGARGGAKVVVDLAFEILTLSLIVGGIRAARAARRSAALPDAR